MPTDPDTHVAFLVSNELRMANWQLKTHSPHLASLVLNLSERKAQIFNSYVPSSTISRDTTTAVLLEARRAIAEMLIERESENNQEAEKSILYLGDFNLHHPEWGGDYANSDICAEMLLETVNLCGMELLTPRGTATYRRGDTKTTVDLAFSTSPLTQ